MTENPNPMIKTSVEVISRSDLSPCADPVAHFLASIALPLD
jgi:hypothetical protein